MATFKCPSCKSYNTYTRDAYREGEEGVCFNCHIFFKMGKPEINWVNVRNFTILFIIVMTTLYLLGFFN